MDYTRSEVLQFVEENDVKFNRLMFCDIFGRLKNISIMASERSKAGFVSMHPRFAAL